MFLKGENVGEILNSNIVRAFFISEEEEDSDESQNWKVQMEVDNKAIITLGSYSTEYNALCVLFSLFSAIENDRPAFTAPTDEQVQEMLEEEDGTKELERLTSELRELFPNDFPEEENFPFG